MGSKPFSTTQGVMTLGETRLCRLEALGHSPFRGATVGSNPLIVD